MTQRRQQEYDSEPWSSHDVSCSISGDDAAASSAETTSTRFDSSTDNSSSGPWHDVVPVDPIESEYRDSMCGSSSDKRARSSDGRHHSGRTLAQYEPIHDDDSSSNADSGAESVLAIASEENAQTAEWVELKSNGLGGGSETSETGSDWFPMESDVGMDFDASSDASSVDWTDAGDSASFSDSGSEAESRLAMDVCTQQATLWQPEGHVVQQLAPAAVVATERPAPPAGADSVSCLVPEVVQILSEAQSSKSSKLAPIMRRRSWQIVKKLLWLDASQQPEHEWLSSRPESMTTESGVYLECTKVRRQKGSDKYRYAGGKTVNWSPKGSPPQVLCRYGKLYQHDQVVARHKFHEYWLSPESGASPELLRRRLYVCVPDARGAAEAKAEHSKTSEQRSAPAAAADVAVCRASSAALGSEGHLDEGRDQPSKKRHIISVAEVWCKATACCCDTETSAAD